MNKKTWLCISSTAANILMLLPLIILFLVLVCYLFGLDGIFSEADSMFASHTGTDTDGWNMLGGMFLSGLGFVGAIIIVVGMFADILAMIFIGASVVVSAVSMGMFWKKKQCTFKIDSIVKLVIDGSMLLLCLGAITTKQPWWVLLGILPGACVACSIVSLCTKNE